MYGNADKRVVLGSDESCEGVATSLHLTSQPGSFTLGDYGLPDGKPEATLKTSLVSERVKALEALATKKKQPDFTSNGTSSHVRDYRHEQSPTEILKSPTEKITPTIQKRDSSADQDPLDFPFENVKQWSQYEETEEWMKVHLPPVPDLDDVDLNKDMVTSVNVTTKEKGRGIVVPDASAVFVGNPQDFIGSPVEDPKKTEISDAQKEPILDSEFEFDLSFLPTPCTWDQAETIGSELPSNHTSVIPASSAPTTGFDSPSPLFSQISRDSEENVLTNTVLTLTGKLESPETSEADSSGESHDTVIEDGVFVPLPSSDPAYINEFSTTPASAAPNLSTEKETNPPNSKKKLMQVPTINVIETDEPNYSEEEMEIELEAKDEDFKVVKHHATEVQKTPETDSQDRENEPPRTRPIETEFVEGYSPPSSPLNSDTDQSPERKILKSLSEMVHQESASKPEDLISNFSQEQSEETQIFSPNYKPSPFIDRNEVGFPNDEWSDEAQNTVVKPCKADSGITIEETNLCTQSIVDEKNNTPGEEGGIRGACFSKSNTIHSDTYMSNSKECFFSDQSQTHVETLNTSTAQTSLLENINNLENFSSTNDAEASPETDPQPPFTDFSQNPYTFFESETHGSINEQDFSKKNPTNCGQENITNGNSQTGQKIDSKVQDTKVHHHEPQGTSSSSVSESTDSFADFMLECLKTRQDKEEGPSKNEFCKTGFPLSQSPSTTVMELKQEQLTISALKELGSSQGEEEEVMSLRSTVSDQDDIYPTAESTQQSPFAVFPNPPGSQSKHVFDSTGSKEIEAIDEWVAEAYHLAKHVLAILSHVSGKTSSLLAVCLLTSCCHLRSIPFFTCTF